MEAGWICHVLDGRMMPTHVSPQRWVDETIKRTIRDFVALREKNESERALARAQSRIVSAVPQSGSKPDARSGEGTSFTPAVEPAPSPVPTEGASEERPCEGSLLQDEFDQLVSSGVRVRSSFATGPPLGDQALPSATGGRAGTRPWRKPRERGLLTGAWVHVLQKNKAEGAARTMVARRSGIRVPGGPT
jgi:hypothetical protein